MRQSNLTARLLWLISIVLAVVLADQWLKRIMNTWIGPDASIHRRELVGSLVAFEYLQNTGAAFGWFSGGTLPLAILSSLIVLVGIGMMVRFAGSNFLLAAFIALIVGGAIGNTIDRFSRGYVIDYVALGRFWKFNLADAAVSIGAILVFITLWRADNHPAEPNTQENIP